MGKSITLKGRKLIIPKEFSSINIKNDENAEIIPIKIPRFYGFSDLSVHSLYLKTISRGGRDDLPLDFIVTDSDIISMWALCPPQTSFDGFLTIQLYFLGENFKWESLPSEIYINNSLTAEPIIPTEPQIYEKLIKKLQNIANLAEKEAINAKIEANRSKIAAERAESAVKMLPIIGENGNWFLFDFESSEYKDTNFPSRG